jgi:hypothetical protein
MGMYTELNIGVEITADKDVIQKLKFMLGDSREDVNILHPLFNDTTRWSYMLQSDSYYFDGQADSKLFIDDLYSDKPMYFLNVRCNLKNYNEEIEKFMDWLCPYIKTEGFLGYKRYEEFDDPTLIYKENGEIVYKSNEI